MNTTSLWVKPVFNKGEGRQRALRRFVSTHPKIEEEFHSIENGKYGRLYRSTSLKDLERYIKGEDEFIAKKGFRIVNEKAYLRFHDPNYYEVEVMYEIEWD